MHINYTPLTSHLVLFLSSVITKFTPVFTAQLLTTATTTIASSSQSATLPKYIIPKVTHSPSSSSSSFTSADLSPNNGASTTPPKLLYYGGPVLTNPEIALIFYGNTVSYTSELIQFYKSLLGSAYLVNLLSEYSVPAGGYTFPAGAVGKFVGTLTVKADRTVLDDTELRSALV
jgi:hypothetical protein